MILSGRAGARRHSTTSWAETVAFMAAVMAAVEVMRGLHHVLHVAGAHQLEHLVARHLPERAIEDIDLDGA